MAKFLPKWGFFPRSRCFKTLFDAIRRVFEKIAELTEFFPVYSFIGTFVPSFEWFDVVIVGCIFYEEEKSFMMMKFVGRVVLLEDRGIGAWIRLRC